MSEAEAEARTEPPEVEMCYWCEERPAEPEHQCPFSMDVWNDDEHLCTCCNECTKACAEDV